MKKTWIILSVILLVVVVFITSFSSVKLTSDNVSFLDVSRSDSYVAGEISEDELKDLIGDLEELTFKFSKIRRATSERVGHEYDILVRDASGKSVGVVQVYDETTITYTTTLLGYFNYEYVAKEGTLDLEKLELLAD